MCMLNEIGYVESDVVGEDAHRRNKYSKRTKQKRCCERNWNGTTEIPHRSNVWRATIKDNTRPANQCVRPSIISIRRATKNKERARND